MIWLLLSLLQGRYYWPVTIHAIVSGSNKHTHVAVRAVVIRQYREADGDKHSWILDSATRDSMVVECIPKIPCPTLMTGATGVIYGITRFDAEHKWWEIHPVEDFKQ